MDPLQSFLIMLLFWTGAIALISFKSSKERRLRRAGRTVASKPAPASGDHPL
jgi:hypothetical protein